MFMKVRYFETGVWRVAASGTSPRYSDINPFFERINGRIFAY